MLITRFFTTEVRGQGHGHPKVVRYNLNIKMHPHTKFEIVTSNNVGDTILQVLRPEVKVTVTPNRM